MTQFDKTHPLCSLLLLPHPSELLSMKFFSSCPERMQMVSNVRLGPRKQCVEQKIVVPQNLSSTIAQQQSKRMVKMEFIVHENEHNNAMIWS